MENTMDMLHVFQQPDRTKRVQLIFVAVENHQGEALLLSPASLPNTVFMVGGVRNVMLATCDVLPDLLLLDTRLTEAIRGALTHHLGKLYKGRAHRTPLVANVQLEGWQEANREAEHVQRSGFSSHQLENLLATAISKLTTPA